MKKSSTIFLQFVIVLIAVCALVLLLLEPRLEGRNIGATNFQIYFQDPFLAYVYLGSIPVFVALYQAFKVLRYAGRGEIFSQEAVRALRVVKFSAFLTAGAIVLADVFLIMHARLYPEPGAIDGPEGAVMLGIIAALVSVVVGTIAAVSERTLRSAVEMKSENDLTV